MAHTQTKEEIDENLVANSPKEFVEYYNENVPDSFPSVDLKTLKEFQSHYPALFEDKNEWIIDKHRKKLMDWLASYKKNDNT